MRPTPAEVIAGVRRVLRDVVEPEVASDYARSRLREVRAVLAQLDWDDAALSVRRQQDTMLGLLNGAREWIAGDGARASAFGDLFPRLSSADAETEGAETLAELNAAHATTAALVVEVGDALAAWTREHPEDTGALDVRRRLLSGLAGQGVR
jgi:hypothetical protein